MKKTTLLLLTSVSCLLSACYTTPEMDENKYRVYYENNDKCCDTQSVYQNSGLRNCIEEQMAKDDANKKTVTIIPTERGTLVVPKAVGDEEMKDTNRVYEVVDISKTDTVVIKEGSSSAQVTATTATVTVTEVEKSEVVEDVTSVEDFTSVETTLTSVSEETLPAGDENQDVEDVDFVIDLDEIAPPAEGKTLDELIATEDEIVISEPEEQKIEKEVLPIEEK